MELFLAVIISAACGVIIGGFIFYFYGKSVQAKIMTEISTVKKVL